MTEIAVFANSQKPIKPRDLKANTPEQRNLQRQLKEAGVFMAIKRGEKSLISTVYDWQETTNEELGQILLAGLYQMPGSARSQKSSIFKKNYPMIFKRDLPYPTNYLIDLLKLYNYVIGIDYKILGFTGLSAGVFANSKLFILSALVGILTKNGKSNIILEDLDYVRSGGLPTGTMITNLENKTTINKLIINIVQWISISYLEVKKSEFASESYPISNFTKLDNNYAKYLFSKLTEFKF